METPHRDVSALLTEHGKQLHALLFRLTLRADVAEDLLQELFCKLATSDGFRRAGNPVGFAFRTAANLAFDWRRAGKRRPAIQADCQEVVGSDRSPLFDLVRREELEQTLNVIGELPATRRDVVVLRYLQQQSYEAIAAQLGKTTDQVRAIAHKAIKQLRDVLEVEPKPPAKAQRMEGN